MDLEPAADEKRMRLRYAGTCRVCGAELAAKTEAVYERSTKTVRCLIHASGGIQPDAPPAVEPGTPGASARREFERRKAKREQRIRNKHPKLGGLILALNGDQESTKAWDTGALGEETLGRHLNALASETFRVLHDRRIPGSRANIDHLAVTTSGIYVIDAKKYNGRPHLKVEGGILRPRAEKLLVGTRDCTKVVDGVLKQLEVVRSIVGHEVPIQGVLCFVEAEWPLIGGSFSTRGVEVLWPKKLCSKLQTAGPLDPRRISELHQAVATALPIA